MGMLLPEVGVCRVAIRPGLNGRYSLWMESSISVTKYRFGLVALLINCPLQILFVMCWRLVPLAMC
jgi:hypothetical protein